MLTYQVKRVKILRKEGEEEKIEEKRGIIKIMMETQKMIKCNFDK